MAFLIQKTDEDQRLVFGWASVSLRADGSPVVDSQESVIAPETLERAAYDYVLRSRDGGLEHERRGVATMVESFMVTPAKLAAMGVDGSAIKTGWWVGFKILDADVWKRVKSGELSMFSIGGKAKRQNMEAA